MAFNIKVSLSTTDSLANTELNHIITGVTDFHLYLYGFAVCVSGAALANVVTVLIKDGANAIFKTVIASGSAIGTLQYFPFNEPVEITQGNNLTLNASAGGAGAIITSNLMFTSQ